MKVLIYGAGNIGQIYAGKLQESGQDVTVLARGERFDELRDRGIVLEDFHTGERTAVRVHVIQHLAAEDAFDLVLVPLPKTRVAEVLPPLSNSPSTPNILFFGHNAAGPQAMIDAVGRERVLFGFPGAAGIPHGGAIRYLVTTRQEQPTTIGELDGSRSERVEEFAEMFETAGFPAAICPDMDAWLKTHVAEVVPTANALNRAGGDRMTLGEDRETLRLMVRAIREGFRVLRALGVPVTPSHHRIFEWIPEPLLIWIARRQILSDDAAIKIGHAPAAQAEMRLLGDEFRGLAKQTPVQTPAIDILAGAVPASASRPRVAEQHR